MKFSSAQEAIDTLHLEPLHGEGGYFATSHRDQHGNAIYFLMAPGQFSSWHKLNERETWVFLDGAPVELFTRSDSGLAQRNVLSHDEGEFQFSIPPATWMAARTTGDFSLVLCFLAPPFTEMTLLSKENFELWKKMEPSVPELIHDY